MSLFLQQMVKPVRLVGAGAVSLQFMFVINPEWAAAFSHVGFD